MNNLATTSHSDSERRYNGRDTKRRRLRLTTEQDSTSPTCVLDALMFGIQGLEKNLGRIPDPDLELDQLDAASSSSSHRVPVLDDCIQNAERPTDSSTTGPFFAPAYYSTGFNHDLGFDEYSRGRTPHRIEHTTYSSRTRPASRAGSASSARSMIDERLEWAHQDRMRSASRDRSVPRSPFHEHSPFYAEHARYTGAASPANDDRSTIAAGLPHGPEAQPFECSRINPFTGMSCNTVFSRGHDLRRHEDDIHDYRKARYPCPHCGAWRSFTRKEGLDQHLRIVHPKPFTPMPRPASAKELLSQCSDLFGGAHVNVTQALYTCECCPEEPKTFDTEEDLRIHESTKPYICSDCPRRFKSIQVLERHEIPHHLRQYSWSCAALTNPKNAIFRSYDDRTFCSYCDMIFEGSDTDGTSLAHLHLDHKFGECNREKKFFRADHFRQHLRHSHGVCGGTWIQDSCMMQESPPPICAVSTSIEAGSALQSAAVSMIRLPISDNRDAAPPPIPRPPTYIPEISTTPNSDKQPVNRFDVAGHGDIAAVSPGSKISDEQLDFLHLTGAASDDSVTRKRRMSSPVSDSAKDGCWTFPATQAGSQAAAVESIAGEDCTEPPASAQRSVSGVEERKPESLHICSMCQRSFARRTILVNHERTHTGERPYSCTFKGCSHTFAQQGDKTRHETTQHTEKTFICGSSQDESPSWGCGKKFRRKDGLLEHHSKTKRGKQCVADRDKLMELGRIGDGESPAFP